MCENFFDSCRYKVNFKCDLNKYVVNYIIQVFKI